MKYLRIGGLVVLALVVLVVVALGAAALWLANADLRPRLQSALASSLQRKVAIGEFSLGWRRGPVVRLRDLAIANLPGATTPDMLRLARLDAEIDWAPLLHGVLQYRRLRATGLELVLERVNDTPNWRFAGGGGGSIGHIAAVPKDRTEFPTLLDARIRDSTVRYRASSGAMLAVAMAELAVSAPAGGGPASLRLDGAYNGTKATLAIDGAPFADLRRATLPYRAHVALAMAGASATFDGTFTKPLDVDGIEGALAIRADPVQTLLAAFGAAMPAAIPARLDGTLHRAGDDWRLDPARGELGGDAFSGTLALTEGARRAPDTVAAKLAFDRLVLDPLVGGGTGGEVALRLDPTGPNVRLQLSAAHLAYRALRLIRPELDFTLTGARADLTRLAFGAGGGRITAAATLDAKGRLGGHAAMAGIDLAAVAADAGAAEGDIGGRLEGRLDFDIAGATLSAALRSGTVQAAVAMTGGRIARSLLEKASADIRAALRHAEGTVPVACLLAVLNTHDGTGQLRPLRLRSADATLAGGGAVDLSRRVVDITIRSENTGFFALDMPIHIVGPITSPDIGLAAGPPPPPRGLPDGLAPAIRQLAAANPCSH